MIRILAVSLAALLPMQAMAADRFICSADQSSPLPQILSMDYKNARAELMKEGWKPAHKGNPAEDEQWAVDAGFPEVEACRNSGPRPCHFNLSDSAGNVLHIVTNGDEANSIVQYFFLCEGDDVPAGLVYQP